MLSRELITMSSASQACVKAFSLLTKPGKYHAFPRLTESEKCNAACRIFQMVNGILKINFCPTDFALPSLLLIRKVVLNERKCFGTKFKMYAVLLNLDFTNL